MTNAVSPSSIPPASSITTYIDQSSASSNPRSDSSTSDEPDGTEFAIELVGSRDAATSPTPPRGRSHHEIPSPVRTSPSVELPDAIQVPPETVNSRDATTSPSPSLPPIDHPPQISAASASAPTPGSPPKTFWKRFPMLNRSAASGDSKRWQLLRVGSIMRRKHRNVEYDDAQQ